MPRSSRGGAAASTRGTSATLAVATVITAEAISG